MDASTAGRSARALELLHSLTYFIPETQEALGEVGLQGRACYFAGRAAPMGAVGAGVVTATFYNFNRELIEPLVPAAWSVVSPAKILDIRYRTLDEAYTRLLGAEVLRSPEMSEAAELASIAARGIPGNDGRPLYAAYADLEWPTTPHLVFWHALTLLREHRGDGHIAALQTAELNGIEALITHTATGKGFEKEFARKRRGWSTEQWNAAASNLTDREILDADGALTEHGVDLRKLVEDITDDLALAPWTALGEDGAARLVELASPWRDTVIAQDVFPDGVFGPAVER
ncbi:SCO6745 family protein [Rhodococcus sovatensis]|uniref:SalK n=1 Tax=Rhodococcus sovatensis TaxID=1805840 RepID=A0ABZ2PRU7_9NOCA